MENNKEILFKSLAHIEVIVSVTKQIKEYKDYLSNPIIKDITLLHIGQIGELTKRFTTEFKEKYNNIDFRAISGLRNIVVHDYSGINYNYIFDTIKNDIPNLKNQYKDILIKDFNIKEEDLKKFVDTYVSIRQFLIEE